MFAPMRPSPIIPSCMPVLSFRGDRRCRVKVPTVAPKIVVDKPAGLTRSLVELLSAEWKRTDRLSLALPGGSVATTFFAALAACGIDWTRSDFFWGDERAVPETDPDSNAGLARRLWLGAAGVP